MSSDETYDPRASQESRAIAATLRWAADRLEAELVRFPKRGAHTRAGWAVNTLRYWAVDVENPRQPEGDSDV